MTDVPRETPSQGRDGRDRPEEGVLNQLFPRRVKSIDRYVDLLATEGVARGLVGPREAPRLWSRHVLNCVVIAPLIAPGAAVCDVGSGAGLPGVVLAIARPDLRVTLLEPLLRRSEFLSEVVSRLKLPNATVMRARAEDAHGHLFVDVVTARAVAPLDRLAGWCLPLCRAGGELIAIKGSTAADEVETHRAAVARLTGGRVRIEHWGAEIVSPAATVVRIESSGQRSVGTKGQQ
ncbi:MAG: 16S rRNA (guanine(527)-N(7))-methyltransferase RsmG [Nocardioidaceae bacterium]